MYYFKTYFTFLVVKKFKIFYHENSIKLHYFISLQQYRIANESSQKQKSFVDSII